jgi:hypothetical protein
MLAPLSLDGVVIGRAVEGPPIPLTLVNGIRLHGSSISQFK